MRKGLPVVAIDFDDVLNNFHEFMVTYVKKHGMTTDYEKFVSYDFRIDLGITAEQNTEWIFDIVENHHDELLPDKMLIKMLSSLQRQAHFVLVTSRCEDMSQRTMLYLEQHAPGLIAESHFLNGMATNYPERRRRKSEVCAEIGAVAMFEDAPNHAEQIALEVDIPVYLPLRPWNPRVRQGVSNRIIPVADKTVGWHGVHRHLSNHLDRLQG